MQEHKVFMGNPNFGRMVGRTAESKAAWMADVGGGHHSCDLARLTPTRAGGFHECCGPGIAEASNLAKQMSSPLTRFLALSEGSLGQASWRS